MPRLPELRLDQRLQLMLGDANVLDRTSRPVKHSHVTSEVPEVARDEARPISLSLAETVERLVRGGYAGDSGPVVDVAPDARIGG